MIEFTCVNCGSVLKLDDRVAGKTGTCPACGGVCTVPERPQAPQRQARRRPERPKS